MCTSFVSLLANQMVVFCEIKILQASAEMAEYDVIGVVISFKGLGIGKPC